MLLRGFTTVRDMGGDTAPVKIAHRSRHLRRTAHLPQPGDDLADLRSRGLRVRLRHPRGVRRQAEVARRTSTSPASPTESTARARRCARAAPPRREPDQAHPRRWCGLDVRPAEHAAVHPGRDPRGGRGAERLRHLRRHPRLHRAPGSSAPSRRASPPSSTATWPTKDTIKLIGGRRHVALDAAVRRGRPPLSRPRPRGQEHRDLPRHRRGLRLGQEVRRQDGVGHRPAPRAAVRAPRRA